MRLCLSPLKVLAFSLVALGCVEPPVDDVTPQDSASADADGNVSPLFDSSDGGSDGSSGDGASGDGGGGEALWLTFSVDDSANKTFADGDIKWTGSFAWDAKSNTIVYADSWLPNQGPYPPLYDDGPLSAGGHEMEGAVKGDHVFSTAVRFVASEDTVLEYGALNEFDNWMWIGPNGKLEVKKGQKGNVAAKGLVLPAHGDIDLRLVLDTKALDAKFSKWSIATHKFFVKGTMNMWTPVQLLDDGSKGDAAAGDGVLTFDLSQNLGKHDGLARAGDEVQFIYVTTVGDAFPEDGQEYKGAAEAMSAGVQAFAATGPGGAMVAVPVELRVDSKGKFKNTAIIVPSKQGGGDCVPACGAGKSCKGGVCVDDVVPCDPACAEGQQCVAGTCQDKPCTPACGAGQLCDKGVCVDKKCEPACSDVQVCKLGVCEDKTCQPACGKGQKCVVDLCVDLLAIAEVAPKTGPMAGGTKLTIQGKAFAAPAKVRVGGVDASDVVVVSAAEITAKTPPGKTGPATVEVEVAGEKVQAVDAFSYDAPPTPTALLLPPLSFALAEGEAATGLKTIVKVPTISTASGPTDGLVVDIGYGPKGTLPNTSPAKPENAWKWTKATFLTEDVLKGEETYGADLGKLPLGDYVFASRAAWGGQTVYGDANGSEDGVGAAQLGTIAVTKPDLTPKFTGLEPAFVAAKGGVVVALGNNLPATSKVVIQSSVPAPPLEGKDLQLVAGKGLAFNIVTSMVAVLPPRPASVSVTPPGAPTMTLENALAVCPIDTPKVDGDIGADWHFLSLMGVNEAGSEWANNSLGQIWAAYDKDNLYVGVVGSVEANNAVVLYLDLDYGAASGLKSPVDLKDNSGAVDDALANAYEVDDGKFGAEFAMASVGMASFTSGNPAESTGAGWRGLANPADLEWLGAPVVAQAGKGIEGSIPLKTLFPNGIPAKGTRVALFAAVTNKGGGAAPKGGQVPQQLDAATAWKITTVAYFDLHAVPGS